MATLETILGIPPEGEEKPKLEQQEAPATHPPVQSAPPTQQPPETERPAKQTQQTQPLQSGATPPPIATPPLTQQNTGRTHMSYVELTQQMSPYKPPTEEELAKERKKQKREAIFAAIGDGLSAFHWAYSTARGTKSMVDPRVSLSGKVRDRYDKLKKERDANKSAYMSAYMKAMQMDDEDARDERNWRRTLERDRVADERDKRDFDNRVQQQETQKEQWQQSFDRQGEQWQKEFKMREKQYGRQNALAWAQHNLAVQTQKDNKELRQQAIAAQGAKAVRGKQLAFSDGNGNNVAIYENVWKGSMEQVFDAIMSDFDTQRTANSNANVPIISNSRRKRMTAQQKDDFVKQHWHKSEAGKRLMQTLAGIDPATMSSSTTPNDSGGLGWGDEQTTDW